MFGGHFGSHGGSHYIRKAKQTMEKYIPNDIPLEMFLIIKVSVQQILLRKAYNKER